MSASERAAETGAGNDVVGAAGLLAGSVLIARALGYLRDAIFAAEVGVGSGADAYFAAFLVPDILGYLMAAGAAATAVTPPYLKRLQSQGPEAAARFASVVVGTVGLVSTALTIVLWVFAEPLVAFQFPDFDERTLASTVDLMRIVLPAQIFFLTGGILRGVLMAHGKFGPQAWAAIIYSAAPIVGGLLLGGAAGFAWGTLAGAVIGQWGIAVWALRKLPGAVGRIRVGIFDGDVREYVWLALPLMLGLSLTTVDEWYEKWFGGQIEAGAIAAITYARKLMMAPVGVVGQAVGAALLPALTRLYQGGDEAGYREFLGSSLRMTLGLGVLASGALGLLGTPLVELLYERRAFTAEDTAAVARLLFVLAFAVPAWVVQQVAVRGFYARGEMWRAMILSTAVALAVIPFYAIGSGRDGVRGLALASAAAISLNALVTVVWLRVRTGAPALKPLFGTLLRSIVIACLGWGSASLALAGAGSAVEQAWVAFPLGAAVYGAVTLLTARYLGDEALRSGIDRVWVRLRRRSE